MPTSPALTLTLALATAVTAACAAEPRDDGLTSITMTTTASSGPDDTTDATMTTMPADSSTSEPADSSGEPACDGQLIEVGAAPEGWEGPVLSYGFTGSVASGPDCGDGTFGQRVATINAESTTCACQCDTPPEDLCAISMFSDCEGSGIGGYGGGCNAFDAPLSQFQANATPLGACVSVGTASTPDLTPSVWGCEIPEDGCSQAPASEGVCVYAYGAASECPTGFENGPVTLQRVTCDGECEDCLTSEYCATAVQLELHDSADCSSFPSQTIGTLECPGGLFSAVRAVPVPLQCTPAVELLRQQLPVSVCCVP